MISFFKQSSLVRYWIASWIFEIQQKLKLHLFHWDWRTVFWWRREEGWSSQRILSVLKTREDSGPEATLDLSKEEVDFSSQSVICLFSFGRSFNESRTKWVIHFQMWLCTSHHCSPNAMIRLGPSGWGLFRESSLELTVAQSVSRMLELVMWAAEMCWKAH